MNRLETVITGIRPIKKLFVIGGNDVAMLTEIIKVVSLEIGGLTNLVLTSSISLEDDTLCRFVEIHDPDIILNYSDLPAAALSRRFLTPVFDAPPLDEVRRSASTPLGIWSNSTVSPLLRATLAERGRTIRCVISDPAGGIDVFQALHYGIAPPDLRDSLEGSIFHRFSFAAPGTAPDLATIHDRAHNLLYMSLGLSVGTTHLQSIYEPDANPQAWFENKPTLVVGARGDVAGMCYFWNMRATFPFNDILWLPVELAGTVNPELLAGYRYVVVPTAAVGEDLRAEALCGGRTVVAGRYYFRLGSSAWESFRHTTVTPVIDGRIQIAHPADRQFSALGVNMNVVYEVGGVPELVGPRCGQAAALVGLRTDINPLWFARLGAAGLAVRERQFRFLRNDPLHQDLQLPDGLTVVRQIMKERGVEVETTPITDAVQQLERMLGGYKAAKLVASERALQILDLLAPKRTARLEATIAEAGVELGSTQVEELARRLAEVPALRRRSALTLAQLEGSLDVTRPEKAGFHGLVQRLYDRGVLLRGKSMGCPHCHTPLWYLLESLSRPLVCYACNLPMEMPIHAEQGGSDSFRLNELLVKAVDQGLIAVLLCLRVLAEQRFWALRVLPSLALRCLEVRRDPVEVDIVATLGRDLGLCEVKTDHPFDLAQTDRLLRTADAVDATFVLLSTMKPRSDDSVAEIETHLRAAAPKRPVMILTREVLLAESVPDLMMHYRRHYPEPAGVVSVVGA